MPQMQSGPETACDTRQYSATSSESDRISDHWTREADVRKLRYPQVPELVGIQGNPLAQASTNKPMHAYAVTFYASRRRCAPFPAGLPVTSTQSQLETS